MRCVEFYGVPVSTPIDNARSQFIGIEHHTDRKIQGIRKNLEDECDQGDKDGQFAPPESVERLIKRT